MMNIEDFKWRDRDMLIEQCSNVEWRTVESTGSRISEFKDLLDKGEINVISVSYNDDTDRCLLVYEEHVNFKLFPYEEE